MDEDAKRKFLLNKALHAQGQNDLPEALIQFQELRIQFPNDPVGHVNVGITYQQMNRFEEGEAVLETALIKFPKDSRIAVEYARVAHRRPDWPSALARWRKVVEEFPENADGAAGFGIALQMMGQTDEAERILLLATQRFPNDPQVAIEYARVAHRIGDWPEALKRWERVMALFPDHVDGIVGASVVLEQLKRDDEVEKLLATAQDRFSNNLQIAIGFSRVAERRADWPEAIRRWSDARAKFPNNQQVLEGSGRAAFGLQIHALDKGMSRPEPSTASKPMSQLASSELMMQFESLGSGCEFGLVQRHFGAEPLGLLRWGAIPPASLTKGLESRFQGLGNPDDVMLFEFGNSREYFFRDKRYSMEMHTFAPVHNTDYDRLFAQQCRRAQYLRDKLIDDLESREQTSKIFVYKRHTGSLSDFEALAIHRALRLYGSHCLLCVRPEDDSHPNGSVEVITEGLFVGYLDGLSATSNAHEIKYDSWLALCNTVYVLGARASAHRQEFGGEENLITLSQRGKQ